MGTSPRPKPKRLAEKLKRIRVSFRLSQTELHECLGLEGMISYTQISMYESGRREPPLQIVLRYARLAGVPTDVLIDDEMDLPDNLPGDVDHAEMKRKYAARGKQK